MLYPLQHYAIEIAVPIQKLCDTWIQIFHERNDNNAFDLSHWDNEDNLIIYFIPTIEDENELNIFLIASS